MKKAAFTLIELLVVISIIAILAAIALPVFNTAQEKARVAQDAANLKNIGIGINTYLNDNEDMMFSQSAEDTWPIVLQKKYVTDWRVFRSPFDKVTPQRPDKRVAPGVPVSYGINVNTYNVHTSKYRSPSELILAAPNPGPGTPMKFDGTSNVNVTLPLPSGGSSKGGTHSNRNQINALYADAHVSSMLWRDFSLTTGDDGQRRWYPEGKPPSE
jgi:prepilin-type N-terminal cleavage/methylation domain-containing protein/prepilin-type processing-associated H-X9-DG protein